ncbi:MAG: GNAT family N-acetyltransferase [Planctomycetota bacterium]
MPLQIRPFTATTDADFAALTRVMNAAHSERPTTPQLVRERDERREPRVRHERFAAELDGEVVGVAHWGHHSSLFHPRRLLVCASVMPAHQGQGIGGRLFDFVMQAAEADVEPISLRAVCREDRARSVRFLEDRGFEPEARGFESVLDLTTFDASPFAGTEDRVIADGIRLATLADARDEATFERWLHGIYLVDVEASKDIPAPEPLTIEAYEHWRQHVHSSNFLADGMHVALDGDQVVGVSMLFTATEPHMLNTGLTGVLRSHRRRGIALALKLRAAAFARARGATHVRTHNDEPNRAMLSINEAMGFEKQPAYLDFYRSIRPDEDEHLARKAARADHNANTTATTAAG